MNRSLLWVILLIVLATAAFGLRRIFDSQYAPIASSPLAGRPECPHDWDFKRGQMALVGQRINVPELHDCQRFIVYEGESAKYQALYAIFASDSLASFDTLATVSVRAAAEVYAEGTYEPLGIGATYNCLYLFRKAGPSTWRAIMAPVKDAQVDCRILVNPETLPSHKELDVIVTHHSGFGGADYPPVARWDWDSTHKEQYIGITCGTAFCQVGDTGFAPSAGFPDPGGASSLKQRRTRVIRGWYDQQFLATFSPAGKTIPSRIRGTIFPDSGLGDYTIGTFTKRWVRVAEVLLAAPATLTTEDAAVIKQYKDSMNYDATAAGGRLNSIWLCYGRKSDCVPTSAFAAVGPCDGDGMWWARIESTHGPTDRMYKCVARRAHDNLGFHVPGTARWRWLASDETTWKRCDNGCCEVN